MILMFTIPQNSTSSSSPTPPWQTCPYCGKYYQDASMYTPATHTFVRFQVADDTFVETCHKELGDFISRSVKSRWVDKDGKPK